MLTNTSHVTHHLGEMCKIYTRVAAGSRANFRTSTVLVSDSNTNNQYHYHSKCNMERPQCVAYFELNMAIRQGQFPGKLKLGIAVFA